MVKKTRVLFCGEASWLSTGFSKLNRNILEGLHATGKYELAEMGSYGNEREPQAQKLPWAFYGVTPNNQQENEIYKSDPRNAFGRAKFDSVAIDFQPDIVWDCVPPGELIHTSNGYVKIENIKSGDRVLTHKGRFRKVKSSWSRDFNGELISINVNGNREPLMITPNHPVLVFRKKNQKFNQKSWKDIYKNEVPQFIPAKDISIGDLVTLPQINEENIETVYDVSKYVKDYRIIGNKIGPKTHGKLVNRFIPLNNDFARLLGYIIGDGYISDKCTTTIVFGINEIDFVIDSISLFERIFGITASYFKEKNKEAYVVIFNSKTASNFLKCLINHPNSSTPGEIFFSSSDIKKGYLRGLIRSDGCLKNKTVSFANSKRNLIYEYRSICTSIGIPTNITFSDHLTINRNRSYEISTFGNASEELALIANKKTYELNNAVITKSSRCARRTQILNGYLVSSVKKISYIPYSGPVYNFEVEEDNSYCVLSFTTHNCRDPWMFDHIANSRLRANFRLFIVPTVDSAPQKKEWIDQLFKKSDIITTYSRFGKKVLEGEGCKVTDVTSPGVDLEVFHPIDKKIARDKHCLFENLLVFGTVMRNQKRKLFPDLFAAYAAFRNKYRKGNQKAKPKQVEIAQKSVLLCHTSWPDVGWDLPELLWRMGLQRHVIFTYKCDSCTNIFTSWFIPCDGKGMALCRICGKHTAHMPNTHNGVTEKELVDIYNLMDVYVHPSICEGWALPITEAKACGIPGMYQNYSAMEDHVENGGGIAIPVGRYYHESETMSIRSLPDLDKMAEGMAKLAFDEKYREKLGKEARECAVKFHNWNITVKKVEGILDGIQLLDREKTWDRPPNISNITPYRPAANLTDEQFVLWCYVNILSRRPDDKGFQDWMNSLKNGTTRDKVEMFFRNEISSGNEIEAARFSKSRELRGLSDEDDDVVENMPAQPNGVML